MYLYIFFGINHYEFEKQQKHVSGIRDYRSNFFFAKQRVHSFSFLQYRFAHGN